MGGKCLQAYLWEVEWWAHCFCFLFIFHPPRPYTQKWRIPPNSSACFVNVLVYLTRTLCLEEVLSHPRAPPFTRPGDMGLLPQHHCTQGSDHRWGPFHQKPTASSPPSSELCKQTVCRSGTVGSAGPCTLRAETASFDRRPHGQHFTGTDGDLGGFGVPRGTEEALSISSEKVSNS